VDVVKFSRLVPVEEIKNPINDYNLNLARYVDTTDPQDKQDIDGHIRGGIPNSDIDELSNYWNLFKSLKPELIQKSNRAGYSAISVNSKDISSLINKNAEIIKFKQDVHSRFEVWKKTASTRLLNIDSATRPKEFVNELGESLLNSFKDEPLIDAYAIYQGFMEYWDETLKDDVYMIVELGWLQSAKLEKVIPKSKERIDVYFNKDKFHSETLPAIILIEKFFPVELESINTFSSELAAANEALESFFEDYGNDESIIKDYFTKSRISKKDLATALKVANLEKDEKDLLKEYNDLITLEDAAKNALSEASDDMNRKLLSKYETLNESEIREILVNSKWIASVSSILAQELEIVISKLSERLSELSSRYLVPLPVIQAEREAYSEKVQSHLTNMGVKWE
jgi:type I restriction enzyme M protein